MAMAREATNMRGSIRSCRNEDRGMRFKGEMHGTAGSAMGRWIFLWLWIFFLAGLSGCMYPISKGVMATVDKDQTFSAVMQDPGAYINSTVLWGGVIEKALDGPEGTELIVRQSLLDSKGYPQTDSSEGDFIVHTFQHLSPEVFLKGTKVTVAGKIDEGAGKKLDPAGDPLPVVRVIEIHAWTERRWGSFPLFRGWEFSLYGPSAQGMAR
jgi:starvation-inducible outer membrane lipoprotein